MLSRALDETEMIALCSSALLSFLSFIKKGDSQCGNAAFDPLFFYYFFPLPVPQMHVGRCRRGEWGWGWSTPFPDSDNC